MSKHGIGTHCTTIAPLNDDRGSIAVTYHRTKVVIFNGSHITLDSGGYRTVTTKRRMNEVARTMGLNFNVYQVNFDWYVNFNGEQLQFDDGMILVR